MSIKFYELCAVCTQTPTWSRLAPFSPVHQPHPYFPYQPSNCLHVLGFHVIRGQLLIQIARLYTVREA
jgi:hypothetical protein